MPTLFVDAEAYVHEGCHGTSITQPQIHVSRVVSMRISSLFKIFMSHRDYGPRSCLSQTSKHASDCTKAIVFPTRGHERLRLVPNGCRRKAGVDLTLFNRTNYSIAS